MSIVTVISITKPKDIVADDGKLSLKCDFCDYIFSTEKRLYVHMCEKKRRFMCRQDKPVKMALRMFQYFHEKHGSNRSNKKVDADKFDRSSYYIVFVKFAKWLIDMNALNPYGYMDWLISNHQVVDRWCNVSLYEMYLLEQVKIENPITAVERNLVLMEHWAVSCGEPWVDFFKKVSPMQAILWIKSGRLSPWVFFTASTAKFMFERFSPEQIEIVDKSIDYDFWMKKVDNHASDVAIIKSILEEHGI